MHKDDKSILIGIGFCAAIAITIVTIFASVNYYVERHATFTRVEAIKNYHEPLFSDEEIRKAMKYHGKPLVFCWDKDLQGYRFINYKGQDCRARVFEVLEELCEKQ